MNENKIIALSKAQSHIGIHTANGITYDTVDLVKANAHNLVRTCNKKEDLEAIVADIKSKIIEYFSK